MDMEPKHKYTRWRKAFWLIFLAILVTLIASLIGLSIFHLAPLLH